MGALPKPPRDLRDEMRKLQEGLRVLRNRSPFFGTGIMPMDGGLQSENYIAGEQGYRFDDQGNVDFDGTARFGGNTTIGGNATITGTLSLPAGIIDNDALSEPVIPRSRSVVADNFTVVITAFTTVIDTSITVPAGCTRMQFIATGRVTAFYNNASGAAIDYLYSRLRVGSVDAGFYPLAVSNNGGSGTNTTTLADTFSGLTPGSTVPLRVDVSSDFATWSGPLTRNYARLDASFQFMR